jgi:hypothetical protein
MNKELEKVNKKFNDDTYPVFPYISNKRITIIAKGFYRKHNAKFRGVTATYDKESNKYKFPLYGMYFIPEDIIIIPEGMKMTPEKQKLVENFTTRGYKRLSGPPRFETYYFDETSAEAKAAMVNKMEYQAMTNGEQEVSKTSPVVNVNLNQAVELFEE